MGFAATVISRRRTLGFLLVVGTVCFVLVYAATRKPPTPRAIVRQYIASVLDGDAKQTAYELWSRHFRNRARVGRAGPAALTELQEQFLGLSTGDRSVLLKKPSTWQPYWPILSPEAGRFLAEQLDSLPETDQENALMLIARCKYKPGARLIEARYETARKAMDSRLEDWYGVALCHLGDYRQVPEWTETLLDEGPRVGVGAWVIISHIGPAGVGWEMIGPVNKYFEEAVRGFRKGTRQSNPRGLAQVILQVLDPSLMYGKDAPTGNPQAYLQRWMSSEKARKKRIESWNWCGRTMWVRGRYGTARKCFEEALALEHDNVDAMIGKGWSLAADGNLDEGAAETLKALALEPDHSDGLYWMARIRNRMQRYEDALKYVRRALDQSKSERLLVLLSAIYVGRGDRHRAEGRFDEAIAEYTKAIEEGSRVAGAYAVRGEVYRRLGKLDEAIADLRKAVEIDPAFLWGVVQLGQAYQDKGLHKLAMATFDRAVALDPKSAFAHGVRGVVYRAQAQYSKAIVDLGHAISLDPQYPGAYDDLARLYLTCEDPKERDPKEGLRLARKAVELKEDHYYLDTLACAYAENGDLKKAIEVQQKAIDLCQDKERATEYKRRIEGYRQGKTYLQQEGDSGEHGE